VTKFITPAEMATRLRIDPSRVRRLAEKYEIGTKAGNRMRVYTEEDLVTMQRHSTGIPGRPVKLSDSLELSASMAEERAAQSIREGDSEAAAIDLRVAAHMRRLAGNHRGTDNDPEQVT
jgi:hypothetical protein